MEKNIDKEYNETLEYLYSQLPMFSRTGAPAYKPGLDTSLRLDEYFGHPHREFKSIHIAGTNGKGSTSHVIASILQSQGYKTGLYTSPHLVDFRERMKVNGRMIPKERVIEFVENWKKCGYEGHPSFFELTMMMAFDWFAKEKIDYGIIEVGMGGRLDSTNIITPLLSVITNISHDHNQFLGNTLREIAGEKAGIIKKGVPVVVGEWQDECADIFIEKASKERAPLTFGRDYKLLQEIKESENGDWECESVYGSFNLPLGGDYQQKNIQTALSAIERLRQEGMEISDEAIRSGIENVVKQTGLSGRWTILEKKPLTIADTGHNLAGLEYNFKQLERLLKKKKGGRLRIVIGFVADKAIDKIMGLLPTDAEYYVTNAKIPRALPAGKLMEKMAAEGFKCHLFPDVSEAYEEAKKEASENDIIFIGGSTFIVADLLTSFLH